tara:strand:+ start:4431 stop:4976 length:546 start_codon:yes stop_codon:yes gene_type:complete
MKYLIEDENFLTDKEKEFLNNEFEKIPFFYTKRIGVYRRDAPVMVHNLVRRYDDPKVDNTKDRNVSPYTDFFLQILIRFTKKYNVPFNKILRSSINLTTKVAWDKTIVHVDHNPDLPHTVFMLYIGKEVQGNLNVYEEDKETMIKTIVPKNFKIVCFGDNVPHQFEYPKKGLRRAVVFTFN